MNIALWAVSAILVYGALDNLWARVRVMFFSGTPWVEDALVILWNIVVLSLAIYIHL